MTALEKAQLALRSAERASRGGNGLLHRRDPRATTLATLAYVATVLSVAPTSLPSLLLLGVFPIVGSSLAGIAYLTVVRRSLYALPLVLLVGAANPLLKREPMLLVGSVAISSGWVEFVAIGVRGLLSIQMAIVLLVGTGFYRIIRGLRRMGLPTMLASQLLLVYRYVGVLVDEAIDMERARASRSYGRRGFGPRMWGVVAGQLLLRAAERARRVHMAMMARGFMGEMPTTVAADSGGWRAADTFFLLLCCTAFAACRLVNVDALFGHVM